MGGETVGSREKWTGLGDVLEVDPICPADGLQFEEEEEREEPRALGIQSGVLGLNVSTVHGKGRLGEDQNYKQSIYLGVGGSTVTLFLIVIVAKYASVHCPERFTAGSQSSSCFSGGSHTLSPHRKEPWTSANRLPQGYNSFHGTPGQGIAIV